MNFLERLDELLEQNRAEEAEMLMEQVLAQALKEKDNAAALTVLNEMVGFYRSISKPDKAYYYGEAALAMLEEMNMKDTIPYATSLLNLATAYRAGGRFADSLKCYSRVEDIYEKLLDPMDLLNASFCNNVSLLYQEMEDFESSRKAQKKALHIITAYPEKYYEQAVTYTNLANTDLQLGEEEEALRCLKHAIDIYEEHNIEDSHYAAALSALGTYYFQNGEYEPALQIFTRAMEGIERNLGRTQSYERMKYNVSICKKILEEQADKSKINKEENPNDKNLDHEVENPTNLTGEKIKPEVPGLSGMVLAEKYYEAYGKSMIHEKFASYENLIAVGLCGEGSDCFGYDDEISRDHDFGPSFCMFITKKLYEEIGEQLEKAYAELPDSFLGYQWTSTKQGEGRRGVQTIEGYFERILGKELAGQLEKALEENNFESISLDLAEESSLCCAVNGEVFHDPLGIFTRIRKELKKGYSKKYRLKKLAQEVAEFTQSGLYNSKRMYQRGDKLTGKIMLAQGILKGCHILYTASGEYAPHDKWLLKGLEAKAEFTTILDCFREAMESEGEEAFAAMEKAAEGIALFLYGTNAISDVDSYLDHHVPELLYKSSLCDLTVEELAEKIARMEFSAFDKVKNEGGRASCQNDWFTFSIMRKSQYMTYDEDMLLQYSYDFQRELFMGHNLIEEKYGRMMESTAPEKYEEIKDHFPVLTEEKKAIIESIAKLQVEWMESFAERFPKLADNARSIHTYEDNAMNTSYETYLRGELGTYSDKMLELYGKYIVRHVQENRNLAEEIMEHNVKMYGYESLEEAEREIV